jgi:hypothetical protein
VVKVNWGEFAEIIDYLGENEDGGPIGPPHSN